MLPGRQPARQLADQPLRAADQPRSALADLIRAAGRTPGPAADSLRVFYLSACGRAVPERPASRNGCPIGWYLHSRDDNAGSDGHGGSCEQRVMKPSGAGARWLMTPVGSGRHVGRRTAVLKHCAHTPDPPTRTTAHSGWRSPARLAPGYSARLDQLRSQCDAVPHGAAPASPVAVRCSATRPALPRRLASRRAVRRGATR